MLEEPCGLENAKILLHLVKNQAKKPKSKPEPTKPKETKKNKPQTSQKLLTSKHKKSAFHPQENGM